MSELDVLVVGGGAAGIACPATLADDLGLDRCASCRACTCGVGIASIDEVIDPLLSS